MSLDDKGRKCSLRVTICVNAPVNRNKTVSMARPVTTNALVGSNEIRSGHVNS
jgi:hypothetical protein